MKKTLSILLTTVITLSLLPATVFAATFNDVSSKHWAYDYIEEMADRNVLSGYPNGSFYPENQVTRAEFAKIMVTASGLKLSSQNSTQYFEDVSSKHWSFPYVTSAMTYLTGYSSPYGNYYYPDKPALREDIAVALVKLKGYDTYGADESMLNTMFTDAPSISGDAKKYVATALERGLISGYEDNTFRGQKSITRAEAAALLWRAYQYGNDNKVTGDEIVENFITPAPMEEPAPKPAKTPTPEPKKEVSTPKPIKTPKATKQPEPTPEPTSEAGYIVKDFGLFMTPDGEVNTYNRVSYDSNHNDVYTLTYPGVIFRRNLDDPSDGEILMDLMNFGYCPETGTVENTDNIRNETLPCYIDFSAFCLYYDNYRDRLYIDLYSRTITDPGSLEGSHAAQTCDVVLCADNGDYSIIVNMLNEDERIVGSCEEGIIIQGAEKLKIVDPDTFEETGSSIVYNIGTKRINYTMDMQLIDGQLYGLNTVFNHAMRRNDISFVNYDFTKWNNLRSILSVDDWNTVAYSMNSNYFYVLDSKEKRIIRCDMKGNLSILLDFDEIDLKITDMKEFNLNWKSFFVVSDDEKNIVFCQKISDEETVARQITKAD